jgi:hypothetical protein
MGRLEITHLNLMLIIADVYTTGIPLGPARMNERPRKVSPVDSTHKNGKGAGQRYNLNIRRDRRRSRVSQSAQSSSGCALSLAENLRGSPRDRLGAPFESGEIQLRRHWRDG